MTFLPTKCLYLSSSSASAKILLNKGVCNDGKLPVKEGVDDILADQVLVSLVLGVDSHTGVTQHGLYPGGRHHDLLGAVLDLVGEADNHPELDLILVPGD